MTKIDLEKAIRCFLFQLEREHLNYPMDKPRAAAIHYGKGMQAKPRHIKAVFDALQPLVQKLDKCSDA